ncbi:MAG: hypothetical protein D6698_10240 [Gammaproteobacteria bacterium]|nr:MAG: hypothetical protein D6698_10240 [Gammaproteobacteria bacterium]
MLQGSHIGRGRQYFEDYRSSHSAVQFFYHGKRYQAQLERNAVEFRLPQRQHGPGTVFRMVFQGARPDVEVIPRQKLASVSHYIFSQAGRTTEITADRYDSILYRNLYNRIDVLFYLKDQEIEYDFILHPGADPSQIQLDFDHLDRVLLSETGLQLFRQNKNFHLSSPNAWQIKDGKRQKVSVDYKLSRLSTQDNASTRITLVTGSFDPTIDLVIDPVLTHLTYLGGSGDDEIADLALDATGDLYVLGVTQSVNFPVGSSSFQNTLAGSGDLFVSKYRVDKNGFTELFSTYIGGGNIDIGNSIVLDSQGNIYVGGTTQSQDFPIPATGGFVTTYHGGTRDGFVVRLDATGTKILAGSFIGGGGSDEV